MKKAIIRKKILYLEERKKKAKTQSKFAGERKKRFDGFSWGTGCSKRA